MMNANETVHCSKLLPEENKSASFEVIETSKVRNASLPGNNATLHLDVSELLFLFIPRMNFDSCKQCK